MNEDLKQYLSSQQPDASFDETGEWLNVTIAANQLRSLALQLKQAPYHFDYLFCLTCVDWKTHVTVVYHLTSSQQRAVNLVVKVQLDRANPEIETVCDIWRTAEFHEREVFEMFGVRFLNHPDLRTLILEDNFEGFPMRKDFEDPVNMIKL